MVARVAVDVESAMRKRVNAVKQCYQRFMSNSCKETLHEFDQAADWYTVGYMQFAGSSVAREIIDDEYELMADNVNNKLREMEGVVPSMVSVVLLQAEPVTVDLNNDPPIKCSTPAKSRCDASAEVESEEVKANHKSLVPVQVEDNIGACVEKKTSPFPFFPLLDERGQNVCIWDRWKFEPGEQPVRRVNLEPPLTEAAACYAAS